MGKFMFYFAAIGWLVSLIVNLLCNVGIDLSAVKMLIFSLHLGAMFVFVFVFLELKNNELIDEYLQSRFFEGKIPLNILRLVLKETPRWMKIIALSGAFYGIINILISQAIQPNSSGVVNGQFVLMDHATVIKIISERTYHFYQDNEIRIFSGVWILFFGFGVTLFYQYCGLVESNEKCE